MVRGLLLADLLLILPLFWRLRASMQVGRSLRGRRLSGHQGSALRVGQRHAPEVIARNPHLLKLVCALQGSDVISQRSSLSTLDDPLVNPHLSFFFQGHLSRMEAELGVH